MLCERNALALGMGRVGGLVRPPGGAIRDAEDAVDFLAFMGVALANLSAVDMGRFACIRSLGDASCMLCLTVFGFLMDPSSFAGEFSILAGKANKVG